MKVVSVNPVSTADWLDFERRCSAPTFFARPYWAQALADAHPNLVAEPLRFVLSDGSTAIVPLMRSRMRGLLARTYSGMPFGTYTAVMPERGGTCGLEATEAVVRALLTRWNVHVSMTLWPLERTTLDHIAARRTPHTTSVIDLAFGLDKALSGMDGSTRRMAGQAARRGVTCAPDNSSEAVAAYHAMLSEAAVGWGLAAPPIARTLLDAVVARGGADVEIWFAWYEGERIAGGVMLYGADEAFFWSAATREGFGTLRPSNALNLDLIAAAVRRGVRWYNLGASEGLPGVARFKAGLGAKDIEYQTLTRTTSLYQLFTVAQRAAAALRVRRR